MDELKVQLRKFYNAVATQHDPSLQISSKGYSKAEKDEVDSCNWIIDKFKEFVADTERQAEAIDNLKATIYDLRKENDKMHKFSNQLIEEKVVLSNENWKLKRQLGQSTKLLSDLKRLYPELFPINIERQVMKNIDLLEKHEKLIKDGE